MLLLLSIVHMRARIYIYMVNKGSLNLKNKRILNNKYERFLTSVGTLASDVMSDYSKIPFTSHT